MDLTKLWKDEGLVVGLSAETYINRIVENFEREIGKDKEHWEFRKSRSPLPDGYHPEICETPFLNPDKASFYRSMVGALQWIVAIGRVDVAYSASSMARFGAMPREGHLEAMYRVFGYLKTFPKGQVVVDHRRFDDEYEKMPHNVNMRDWFQQYPGADAILDIPEDAPEALGKEVRIRCYFDADHAHDLVTRRSITGILIYVNKTPIKWYSKRQPTVETSTYASELTAERIIVKQIIAFRYMLIMMGVKVVDPSIMLGDNNGMVLNTTIPGSVLKKKNCAVAYHRVREAYCGGLMIMAHVRSEHNRADVLTKAMGPLKHMQCVWPIMFSKPAMILKSGVTHVYHMGCGYGNGTLKTLVHSYKVVVRRWQ